MDHTVSHQNRYTADEYYKAAEAIAERTELRDGQIVAMARPSRLHQRISSRLHHAIDSFITANHGS